MLRCESCRLVKDAILVLLRALLKRRAVNMGVYSLSCGEGKLSRSARDAASYGEGADATRAETKGRFGKSRSPHSIPPFCFVQTHRSTILVPRYARHCARRLRRM